MYLGIVYIYQTSGQTLAIAADRPLKQYKKIAERIKFILWIFTNFEDELYGHNYNIHGDHSLAILCPFAWNFLNLNAYIQWY